MNVKKLCILGFSLLLASAVALPAFANEPTAEERIREFVAGQKSGDEHGSAHDASSSHEKPKADSHAPAPKPKAKAEKKEHAAPAKAADAGHGAAAGGHDESPGLLPGEALKKLLEGNKRYVANRQMPQECSQRRAEIANSQKPFAIIVSCSDSRVPPEVVFDQSLGDLFVVRTAGHVVDAVALGSIEYAVEHLGATLIFVMGHERCGAVKACVAGGEPGPGHIGAIIEAIKPALEKAKAKEGDLVTNTINANVKLVAEAIRQDEPIVSEKVADGVVRIAGGFYDLDTGYVSIVYNPSISL